MIKGGGCQPQVERRRVNRVSSAVWPASTRRGVATGKAAQRRRDWIMQGRWWVILVDALSMRVLLMVTTLLVVISSLLVAILGLSFWYLLLLPLLLFALMLFMPAFLESRASKEMTLPALSAFAQEFKSSAGMLSLYAQELKSNSGLLSAEAPSTPMPVDQPLVRVLETFDLRKTPIEYFLADRPAEETGEHALVHYVERDFWVYAIRTELPELHGIPYSQVGAGFDQCEGASESEIADIVDERELLPGPEEREIYPGNMTFG